MRILMVTQWFYPEPAFKGLGFAKALRDQGHEVEVLTGFPNYPEGTLYPGYRIRPLQREVTDGIPVVRVPLYPSHDMVAHHRIANYASFGLAAAALGPWTTRRPDVAYVYHPPATVALPALALRCLRGVPFVYDIQDLWPDTLAAVGAFRNPLALRLVRAWCNVTYRMAARIAVLSAGFKRRLVERGVASEKIEVIHNWCDEATVRRGPRDEDLARRLGLRGRFNVLFAGTMGVAQGLDAVLEAARLLATRAADVQLVFVGGGAERDRLVKKAGEMRLENVRFIERRPMNEISAIMNLADVLLVHLKENPLFEITVPSKLQAYLAQGRPILVGVKGDAAELLRRSGAGLTCEPEKPASICDAIAQFRALPVATLVDMGRRGMQFYDAELSMQAGVARFESLLRQAAEHE